MTETTQISLKVEWNNMLQTYSGISTLTRNERRSLKPSEMSETRKDLFYTPRLGSALEANSYSRKDNRGPKRPWEGEELLWKGDRISI